MKRLLTLLLASTLAATGCAPYGAYGWHEHHPHHMGAGEAVVDVAALIVAGAVAASAQSEESEAPPPPVVEEHVVYVPYGPPPSPAALEAPPAPRVTAPDPQHKGFDQVAALGAIHAIDVSECTAHGAPRAYAHARVTFDANGRATRVVIDEPSGLSKEAVDCLGDRIGRASAPPFEGSPVTVGAGFYVR